MKEIVKTSRLAGQLEKLYNKLNADFFSGELIPPVITIQSTPRAYGHYTLFDAWSVKGEGRRELNIGAGTLDRPIELTITTLLHEMCHQFNHEVLNEQDSSRGGTYHNKRFKQTAEEHGLTVTRSDKYGWSHTAPSDLLLDWILNNNIQDIKLSRNDFTGLRIAGGSHTANGSPPITRIGTNNSRRYVCPRCNMIARTTKAARLICGDCMLPLLETP